MYPETGGRVSNPLELKSWTAVSPMSVLGPLQEKPVLLTIELALQPLIKSFKKKKNSQEWSHRTLIPVLGRQRQVDFYEFEASLLNKLNSRTVRTTQKKPVSKNKKPRIKKIKEMLTTSV